MAEIKSVHSLMEDYQRHVTRLEELRQLLEERLVVARAELHRLSEQRAGHRGTFASAPGGAPGGSGNAPSGSGNAPSDLGKAPSGSGKALYDHGGSGDGAGGSLRQVRLHVIEIESAIERMDRGLYGTCKQCGAFIPLKELLRAPHEQRCAACADAERTRSTA
ncbi:TraR/DksA C4-type zinc finger protein [Sphaerisporangium sp. NPDC049002]|uniref:TraR/DksA family transcriptional regulator n=1 Tax=unclassified Sphaerisporangium TaxID=2630420 RepID=UPI0034027D0D